MTRHRGFKKHGVKEDTRGTWFWTQQDCFDSAQENGGRDFFACMDKNDSRKGSKMYAHFADADDFVEELYRQDQQSRCMYELITKKNCCLYIDFDGESVSEDVFMNVVRDTHCAICEFCGVIDVPADDLCFVLLTSSRNDESGRHKQSIHLIVKTLFFEDNVSSDLMLDFVLCLKKYVGDVSISDKVPSGQHWQRLKTPNAPRNGILLENDALERALQQKIDFSRQEWEEFGISELLPAHYVRAGGCVYKPCGSREFIDKNVYTQNRAWRPPWGEKRGSGVPLLEMSHGKDFELSSDLYVQLRNLRGNVEGEAALEQSVKAMIKRGLVTLVPESARRITRADLDAISAMVDSRMLGMFWVRIATPVKSWTEITDEDLRGILVDRQKLRRTELDALLARIGGSVGRNSFVRVLAGEGRYEFFKPFVPSVIGFASKSARENGQAPKKRPAQASPAQECGEESASKAACSTKELIPPYFRRLLLHGSSEVSEYALDAEKLPVYVKRCLDLSLCRWESIKGFYIRSPRCCPYRALMDAGSSKADAHKSNNARALMFIREDLRAMEELQGSDAGSEQFRGVQFLCFCNDAECRASFCAIFSSVPRAKDFNRCTEIKNIPSIFRKTQTRSDLTPLQKIFMTPFYPHATVDAEDRKKFLKFIISGYEQVARAMAGKTTGQLIAVEYTRFLEYHGGWCLMPQPQTVLDTYLREPESSS